MLHHQQCQPGGARPQALNRGRRHQQLVKKQQRFAPGPAQVFCQRQAKLRQTLSRASRLVAPPKHRSRIWFHPTAPQLGHHRTRIKAIVVQRGQHRRAVAPRCNPLRQLFDQHKLTYTRARHQCDRPATHEWCKHIDHLDATFQHGVGRRRINARRAKRGQRTRQRCPTVERRTICAEVAPKRIRVLRCFHEIFLSLMID